MCINIWQLVLFSDNEVCRKDEIVKFVAAYGHLVSEGQMKDVHVPVLRHILPMLLMEAYSEHYTGYVRKGKHLFRGFFVSRNSVALENK